MPVDPNRRAPATARRGTALLFAIIGIVLVALLAASALRMVGGERLVLENAQAGTQAAYLADQALSQFYENYRPGDNLEEPTAIEVLKDGDDEDTSFVFSDYSSTDLKAADIVAGDATVRITPTKLLASDQGDLYMLDARVLSSDPRSSRPVTARTMRTFATVGAPVTVQAALTAPGGLYVLGGAKKAERLDLKGLRVDKCGVGANVPGLATPATRYAYKDAKEVRIEPSDKGQVGHDSTTDSYGELVDSLNVRWAVVSSAASYGQSSTHLTVTPAQFGLINWSQFNKRKVWPTILVTGDVNITAGYKGFGMLTVTGSLNVQQGVFKWDGLVVTGKKLTVANALAGGKDAHTHIKGAVVAGLDCTEVQAAAGDCRVEFGAPGKEAEHLGVAYSGCNVRAAMAAMMVLRPTAASRHARLF